MSQRVELRRLRAGDLISIGRGLPAARVTRDPQSVVHHGAHDVAVEYRECKGTGPARIALASRLPTVLRLIEVGAL